MAKMILLDVERNVLRRVSCRGLEDYYREIGCDTIDIVSRNVGGKNFDIIVDDEGLLKDPKDIRLSAIDKEGKPALVGNLLFAHHDGEGNEASVADEDYDIIKKAIKAVMTAENGIKCNLCVVLD